MEKQTTVRRSITYSGIGLHTGNECTITFVPAPANYGYKFVRTDLDSDPEIDAVVDNVIDLSRGTTIAKNSVQVQTVEHVLASLVGLRIDNCRIELSASEPPVFDGSSKEYVEALQQAGIEELEEPREYFVVEETVRYTNEEKGVDIVALPTDDYRITVMIDYYNPALGSQHTGLFDLDKEFVSEFAPARTFCFLTEVESLWKEGLIKGGNLENAIVIVDKDIGDGELEDMKDMFKIDSAPVRGDNGILNNTDLRFKNEPARHKLLDMLGDLSLIGVPIKAQILAARPGHASNIEFARKIRNLYMKQKEKERYLADKPKPIEMDIQKVLEILPHRYPFLLVDRVLECDVENKKILAYKNLTMNEEFFQGHFPEKPVMPGVLILESLAQAGGLLLSQLIDPEDTRIAFFMAIKNAKFRKPVVPGDRLVLEIEVTGKRFNTYSFTAKAFVDGQVAAESEFQAALVEK